MLGRLEKEDTPWTCAQGVWPHVTSAFDSQVEQCSERISVVGTAITILDSQAQSASLETNKTYRAHWYCGVGIRDRKR